jgi:glutamate---cysteine ligase / carboxylate-amine ligase
VLAKWFRDHHEEWMKTTPSLKHWIYRENKWRAIRYGLEASIITSRTGQTELLQEDLERWMVKLQPYIHAMKYDRYVDIIPQVIAKGNSSQRQRKVYNESGDLIAVILHNIMEFEQGQPIWN